MRGAVVSISVSLSLLICTRLIFNTNEKWNGVGGFFGSSHSLGLWNVLRSRLPVPDPRTVQVTTDDITGLSIPIKMNWSSKIWIFELFCHMDWTLFKTKKVIKEATHAKNNLWYMGIQKEKKTRPSSISESKNIKKNTSKIASLQHRGVEPNWMGGNVNKNKARKKRNQSQVHIICLCYRIDALTQFPGIDTSRFERKSKRKGHAPPAKKSNVSPSTTSCFEPNGVHSIPRHI